MGNDENSKQYHKQLAELLERRKQDLINELRSKNYTGIESVKYSKYQQIDACDTLLTQLGVGD